MGKDLVFSIRLRGGSGRGDVPTCGEGEAPRLTLSLRKRRNTDKEGSSSNAFKKVNDARERCHC
uniref:Uncharacterized protein n=1 Tax=Oryza rufipogon TaxID=4529 RepID=A0A0E0MY15_ORYRU